MLARPAAGGKGERARFCLCGLLGGGRKTRSRPQPGRRTADIRNVGPASGQGQGAVSGSLGGGTEASGPQWIDPEAVWGFNK